MPANTALQVAPQTWASLFTFLEHHPQLCPNGRLRFAGHHPEHIPTPFCNDDQTADLTIVFLDGDVARIDRIMNQCGAPLFMVGQDGAPETIEHICIPFEGRGVHKPWLRSILKTTDEMGWKGRLVHCDHGLVPHEIIRLATWLQLDGIRKAMEGWLTDDTAHICRKLIDDFPDTEVKAGVGKVRHLLEDEDPSRVMLMGSLTSGYHLPHRHHGLNYAKILAKSGMSGYLIADPK